MLLKWLFTSTNSWSLVSLADLMSHISFSITTNAATDDPFADNFLDKSLFILYSILFIYLFLGCKNVIKYTVFTRKASTFLAKNSKPKDIRFTNP